MNTTFAAKLENFRLRVETDQIARYRRQFTNPRPELEQQATTVRIKPGTKYCKVDVGSGGRYMVEVATGNIFGIKGYGQVHKGHFYGTLDTTADYFWGEYYPIAAEGRTPLAKQWSGVPAITTAPQPATSTAHSTLATVAADIEAGDVAIGDRFNVIPRPNDLFQNEFVGRVDSFRNGHVVMVDQDDNAWEVDRDQLLAV